MAAGRGAHDVTSAAAQSAPLPRASADRAAMPYRVLIQPAELAALLATPQADVVLFDCSFDLADTAAGERAYAEGHLPGAQYLHLDRDLSGAKTGRNGRHPLPERAAFAQRMAQAGVGDATQVVAYDAMGGVYASRLWWMLRWAGHADVAVLDGGLGAWRAAGGAVAAGAGAPAPRSPGRFTLRPPLVSLVDYEALSENLDSGELLVLDARSPDRFRGENETIDPVPGHIPGARNRFFKDNLAPDGRFKAPAQLAADFAAVSNGHPASQLVAQCGSGVTACHNLLALEVAGLTGAALYPGSWSEWIAHPAAPVATGDV